MKKLLFILIVCCSLSVFGQTETINIIDQNGMRQGKWHLQVLNDDSLVEYDIECHYVDDKLSGSWIRYDSNKLIKDVRVYFKGELEEETKFERYDNGNMKTKSTYQLIDGERVNHSEWITYYESGNVEKFSVYNKGKPTGEWLGYYENGVVKYRMIYEENKFKSLTEYDKEGNIKK